MEGEIVNRVSKSPLVTLNLEDFYPRGSRHGIDISQWLDQGLILREKPFRDALTQYDWSAYQDGYVHLFCTTDAIVPSWAYMLISMHLGPYARKVVVGSRQLLDTVLLEEALQGLDLEPYRDKPVIIKGCSQVPVPESAYVGALSRLMGEARSIQFGEACSSVPLYKRK